MLIKMTTKTRSREEDNTKDGETLRRELLHLIESRNYYRREELQPILETRLAIPLADLDTVLSRSVEDGNVDTITTLKSSDLHILELLDRQKSPIGRLFVQCYFSGMKNAFKVSANMFEPETMEEKLKQLEYRCKHLQFWNGIYLPSPLLVDFVKNVNERNGEFAAVIITDYWSGATHNLDIIAIDGRNSDIDKLIADTILVKGYDKSKLLKEKEDLLREREKIPRSALETVDEFAIAGTDSLDINPSLKRIIKVLGREFYERKIMNYFEQAYRWHCKVDPNFALGAKKKKIIGDFKTNIEPVLEIIADSTKFVYAQGDEFIHNYMYRRVLDDDEEYKLVSGVFDSERSCLNRLERSRAKLFMSPLLYLSYESEQKFLDEADNRLLLRLSKLESGSIAKERLAHIILDQAKSRLEFDLIALYEGICTIGRVAQDDLLNRQHVINTFGKSVRYSNPHINFPSGAPISVNPGRYNSRENITRLKTRLSERFDTMISGNTPYGVIQDSVLLDSVKGLREILAYFTIRPSITLEPWEISEDDLLSK
mgnify:CR=1 FL=1